MLLNFYLSNFKVRIIINSPMGRLKKIDKKTL